MADKIIRQKRTVEQMIRLYCRRKEGNKELCGNCRKLLQYTHDRLDNCRYGKQKSACKHCPTHCYKPAMQEKIRQVMRFSGPRMLLYAPHKAIKHWLRL